MVTTFRHAIEGIIWAVRHHKNFKIHLAISLFVLLLASILRVSKIEWLFLIFAIILGLVVEMVNTALEEMTNLITIKWAKQAKITKDVSAGTMLLTAIGVGVVGLLIFLPYILEILKK